MYLPAVLSLGVFLPSVIGGLLPRHTVTPSDGRHLTRRNESRVPSGHIINHCTEPGVVALTFDDGPYMFTNHVLDLLDQYDAKATFFVNGNNYVTGLDDESTPWPGTLRRMIGAGHQIGSHAWAHMDMSSADSDIRHEQLTELEHVFAKVLGKIPRYFRPPYATCNTGCLNDVEGAGYHVINFDVDTKDYLHDSPDTISISEDTFAQALDGGGPESSFLVLSHDVHEYTAKTLTPFMLKKIKEKGYRAVTVGECLGDSPSNWYRT
ncbi:carbohydrate esterase family 4 protein [Podospora didyma]|uniref:Carbohydrate esterase family 4 protein n=1 Tax=Podospora didyma TaxID=330526 RepID=A0AAE0KE13_9PEZI|nr:carbohydrate esterase family 4 protein [Podospora didyma]